MEYIINCGRIDIETSFCSGDLRLLFDFKIISSLDSVGVYHELNFSVLFDFIGCLSERLEVRTD